VTWLNIVPRPCLFEDVTHPPVLWDNPQLTHIGHRNLITPGGENTIDIYAGGPDRNAVWFFSNTTNPAGVLLSSSHHRIASGGSIAYVSAYNVGVPDPSVFLVPTICFPRFNSSAFRFPAMPQVTSPRAIPALPPAFTAYLTGLQESRTIHESTIFYDSSKTAIRIDANGYTILQVGLEIYRFSREVHKGLSPVPCEHFTATAPIWKPPVFQRLVGNVTFAGVNAQIWMAPDYQMASYYQYWYFAVTDGSPLYFMDGIRMSSKVNNFEPLPPAAGVFDAPDFCFSLTGNNGKMWVEPKPWQYTSVF